VSMTLQSKLSSASSSPDSKATSRNIILNDVEGVVPRNELTAIMGPSGAGKSTLLQILSGRIGSNNNKGIRIAGNVYLDGVLVNPQSTRVRKRIAYVAQDDSLQVTSTPQEAIRFSAKLRLPKSTKEKQLDNLTSQILTELGLDGCADTMIGGALIKGISGGERKRTSVGIELVVKPSVIFLDEPTSGLDSYSAKKLCQVLKKVSVAGSSVLLTIHQPSSEIFNGFDRLILLSKGNVMYQGSVSNLHSYFENRGYPIPTNYNPADWIMSIAQENSIQTLGEKGFFSEEVPADIESSNIEHNNGIDTGSVSSNNTEYTGSKSSASGDGIKNDSFSLRSHSDRKGQNTGTGSSSVGGVGVCTEISMLLQREFNYLYRDTKQLAARAGLSIVMSLLIGSVYWKVGSSDLSDFGRLQSLFGALTLILMHSIMGPALPALLAFPVERPVFLREYSTDHYSVFSYFISRLLAEAIVTGFQNYLTCQITYLMLDMRSNFFVFFGISYALGMTSTAMAVAIGSSIEDPKLGTELAPLVFVPQLILSGFFVAPSFIPSWLRWARYTFGLTYSLNLLLMSEFGQQSACGENEPAQFFCEMLLKNTEAEEISPLMNWILLVVLFCFFRLMALLILKGKAKKYM